MAIDGRNPKMERGLRMGLRVASVPDAGALTMARSYAPPNNYSLHSSPKHIVYFALSWVLQNIRDSALFVPDELSWTSGEAFRC